MTQVNVHEAKTHLSKLLDRVAKGEEIVLAKAGKPVAKLVAVEPGAAPARRMGMLAGRFTVPDDIKTAFEKEINEMFYGEE